MAAFENAYATHHWTGRQAGGSPFDAGSCEWVCHCKDCGCENIGDPDEFPWLKYPACEAVADGAQA